MPLNIFYEEPNEDRWLPFDRYPRQVIRRLVRGKPRVGGQKRVFLNLCAGLDRLGVSYKVNDYKYIQKHPEEIACIIGKPYVLDKISWKNPIIFGPSAFSHPYDDLNLLQRLPVKKVLVPGEWMKKMWEPYYGYSVVAWPVGIDTDAWVPASLEAKDIDILLYDKILWEHDIYENELITPIKNLLEQKQLKVANIRYGFYKEQEFHSLLNRSKAMIFLCKHETQGIAYQQTLSCGVPILAWDKSGFWDDPSFFPERVQFAPVSSVPYWDERCGVKFMDIHEFPTKLEEFLDQLNRQVFYPRDYILENLTLEASAQWYIDIVKKVQSDIDSLTKNIT
ncbi:glycosyltransferase involved in cell wall biosynthesis [Dulcicalothrix desertica PCC 7102]|nr:glycosyltransferase involved in cell wall biosynthesis [Dulcicalothrix desertica PCC 7102]